ncbi:MAG: type II CAAX endopeptidase family protein [Candidatus Micrarchaeota archaeon]
MTKKNRKIKGNSSKFKAISYSLFYILLFSFILLLILYFYSYITINVADISTTVAFSFLLPALAFAYLAHSGKSLNEAFVDLGVTQRLKTMRILGIGILLFLAIFVMELIITVMSVNFKLNIETNACTVVTGMPLWFILFVVLIGPINEELFFRGFLVKRIGIISSALLFAILHAGYGSTFGIDIIAAFIFGLIAGYIFKKTNSIYPTLLAHVLINLIAVLGCI